MAASMLFIPCFLSGNVIKALEFSLPKLFICKCAPKFAINNALSLPKRHLLPTGVALSKRFGRVCCRSLSSGIVDTISYEFSDSATEVELRLKLGSGDIQSSRDISVDADESSLTIRKHCTESPITLIETNNLYGRIKPAETIWYLDEDQLVVNLKKQDPDLKWPDIMESWESLTVGVAQLLKGTSIYIVGESTEINQKIAQKLAVGLGYTPLNTGELLEEFSKQDVDSWVKSEGVDSVAELEAAILESLSSHVRAVVATLGGRHGAAGRADKWRHLYAGFTVWLSKSKASGERREEKSLGMI
ncbi:PREDICTED: probable inactive shikimate kinase like 2, chloroplastic isoform X2 [Nelumbo nucifera]|uniref:CS domain-containing protein n=2 Tax=Nelumbo nucifera TaxID=4432 RepID=A0A822Z0P0_NELNU|nr:PREDICTED: probable inactive shikimate kinase like 2, chloroplastic isoform X2 [Nelumbo nucifera]DAD36576.1 TPA_asm: hypothetical protein HUJ06_007217 [Nelumbo nucifera]